MLLEPGTEIDGHYRIGPMLGEGSMGTVYAATALADGADVAIKVLHRQLARDPAATRRFAREARAASDIGHPGIVAVRGSGTHEGTPYLVMSLLRGETLAGRLQRERRLPVAAACEIVGHVLSALASTHAQGIVHRDLKPDNVFLEDVDGATRVKLLDFGISKFRRVTNPSDEGTREGHILGTPGYMAPEQWMGRRDIDHRADLFAAGAILYELLTGRVPYGGENQSEFFLEVVRGTQPPELPSRLVDAVPAALERAILRALERDRRARFGCAQDLLDALRPFGAGAIDVVALPPAPVVDQHPSVAPPRPARRPRTAGTRPRPLALLIALALLGVALGALARRSAAPPRSPPVVAVVLAAPEAPPRGELPPLATADPTGAPAAEPGATANRPVAPALPLPRVPPPTRSSLPARHPSAELQALPIAHEF